LLGDAFVSLCFWDRGVRQAAQPSGASYSRQRGGPLGRPGDGGGGTEAQLSSRQFGGQPAHGLRRTLKCRLRGAVAAPTLAFWLPVAVPFARRWTQLLPLTFTSCRWVRLLFKVTCMCVLGGKQGRQSAAPRNAEICQNGARAADPSPCRPRPFRALLVPFPTPTPLPLLVLRRTVARRQVVLTADYAPGRLLELLSSSQWYPLEAALEICEQRGLVDEQVCARARARVCVCVCVCVCARTRARARLRAWLARLRLLGASRALHKQYGRLCMVGAVGPFT
jgi:hypothetical protein